MVMERSPHVLLSGEGAEEFALEQGVTLVPGSYFYTERRWKQLEEAQRGKTKRVASPPTRTSDSSARSAPSRATATATSPPRPRPAA